MKPLRALTIIILVATTLAALPGQALGDSDEVLYVLAQEPTSSGGEFHLVRVDFTSSGFDLTSVVELTNGVDTGEYLGAPSGLVHDGTDFYMTTIAGINEADPGLTRLYTINTSTGATTLVGNSNIEYGHSISKDHVTDTFWIFFDEYEVTRYNTDSFAEIDLADAQVDTNTIQQPAGGGYNFATIDAFGSAFGYLSGSPDKYFRTELSTGNGSPNCSSSGFETCFNLLNSVMGHPDALAVDPDTADTFALEASGSSSSPELEIRLVKPVGGTVQVVYIGATSGFGSAGSLGGATFAPNTQSDPPPLTPDEKAALIYNSVFDDTPTPTPTP